MRLSPPTKLFASSVAYCLMKSILFVLNLLAGVCLAAPTIAQPFSPAEARDDLHFLKRKLDLLHPGMGFYTPKNRIEYLYDSLYSSLNAPVNYLDFYHHLSPLVNSLKDGHTNLNHRRGHINRDTRYLPFFLRKANDARYYISHNISADTTLRRGTQLLAINGREIANLHRDLMNADRSGSDGDNLTGRHQWSLYQFADYYAAWFGSTDSLTITYRNATDSLIRQTRIACPRLDQFRARLHQRYGPELDRQPNLAVRIVDTATHTALLRVSTFMSPKKYDPFQWAFNRRLKRAFRQLKQQGVENLIVDMQNNGGGVVVNSARLLQYWLPNRFRVMAREHLKRAARAELITRWNPFSALNFSLNYKPDGHGGFASRAHRQWFRPRQRLAFRGNLYFLMNGASFSATTTVLAKTLDAGLGTFVGEATGGAYWGDFAGHFKTITLPNSRIQVRIPLKKLTHAVSEQHANGFTVEPDYAVSRTQSDILQGRDALLDHTLHLIRWGVVAHRRWPASAVSAR